MIRGTATLAAVGLALALAQPASGAFGINGFDVSYRSQDGSPVTQAGAHPFAISVAFHLDQEPDPTNPASPRTAGEMKDMFTNLPAGLSFDQAATPTCPTTDFLTIDPATEAPDCPDQTALGAVVIRSTNTLQGGALFGSKMTFWGVPADPAHDAERGPCILHPNTSCPQSAPEVPLLRMPSRCDGPLLTTYAADSWQHPGPYLADGEADLSDPAWSSGVSETHYPGDPPIPLGLSGCASLPFSPTISAKPTTLAANSPSGLDFSLDVHDEGIASASGIANSEIEEAAITLPQGFTINPSLAAGLGVCTGAQLARETASSAPGAGCPDASAIGTVEASSPVLSEPLRGSLFIAKPYENPFGSLLALYVVLKSPTLGLLIRQPLRVETDPRSGQLTTFAPELPQLPFSHFKLHFREGTRSPLASPPACGTYTAGAKLTPRSGAAPITTTSAFAFTAGPEAGPCPTGGLPPFRPGILAGTLNNAARHFSPFYLRLSRNDTEQEITHFSAKLAPGLTAKLAGIPFCPDSAIAAAAARKGPTAGAREDAQPSCPAASALGRTLVGFGVGPILAYAPGRLYLAGPYHGSALSVASITAARIGPFDLGTVVVRDALRIDPQSAQVFIDATGSDPIPHIIKGIPTHLRDIRVYAERPGFVLNPSSCERTSSASTLLGAGLDFSSPADDRPVTVSTPFQAADCAGLPFKPHLGLSLGAATRRGAHPALRATLSAGGIGEAGIASAELTLPRSEFIANSHFKTICTRAQFKATEVPGAACPPGSVYGQATIETPLLDRPLRGPLILRSSERRLPDLVAALSSDQINIVVAAAIDSVAGRLKASFRDLPDAPLKSATFTLAGAAKGLFENSTDLCRGVHRAILSLTAQNDKHRQRVVPLRTSGCKSQKRGPR